MELSFTYQKKRSEFGRQCMFSDRGPETIDNYVSNKKYLHEYILKDPVHQGTQETPIQAEHELNTYRAEYQNGGMNHIEGGWPKDVNTTDEEQTKRYKRKIEKEESYPHIMGQLIKNMEECILQNNAINIYQQYYTDTELTPFVEQSSARTVNVFSDQCLVKRPVTHISWSPDGGTKLAVSHCNMEYQHATSLATIKSYLWEIENPNTPYMTLNPPTESVCVEYNQKDPFMMASGQFNGQVAMWDIRRGAEPYDFSLMESSHHDPVHSVLWVHSKSGTEFFSGSTDGTIKWWDHRKLRDPLETLILDAAAKAEDQQLGNAVGCTVLEYEPTIPTKYMVGTEYGTVISGNKKGKSPLEKMVAKFNAHLGPVLAIQRNAAFVKNFLTIGDWTAKIWSEDCKESSIMWTNNHRCRLSDGGWSPTRYSVFFTCRSDGILDIWDILQNQQKSALGVKVCDDPLTSMRTHEQGRLVAIGNKKGTAYILELSENLCYSNKNDKALLTAMFERETRREKILEARGRELRLKMKAKVSGASANQADKVHDDDLFSDPLVQTAEREFYEVIDQELNPQVKEEVKEVGEVIEVPDDDDNEPAAEPDKK